MHSRYLKLPPGQQNKLMNAGYKTFALYPYQKASMALIANSAGISKSLLFYYFTNKKEYYLYLFDTAVRFLSSQKAQSAGDDTHDLFELVERSVKRRLQALQAYPYVFRFVAMAYYETEPGIREAIGLRKQASYLSEKEAILKTISRDPFENPGDAEVLLDIILFIAEGCMRGVEDLQERRLQDILPTFRHMMRSLQTRYYKPGYAEGKEAYAYGRDAAPDVSQSGL